ncbi:TetR/AcrR family transcriptional regulator [Aldersonia sp. NBC_00410]|uniref:TetR/AcrR family transcriptional regulator n=1 Tax=Aldersonia sp. NBC_00410 TaxID=2975954 RepID=UPI00225280E7|nr:TetR/AcrR family transcriptional regulator [Aldersonia sp. NBC_00410]MCX5043463.1 TetR/AcrR family transcriptional regulator [Aldersonia sp. NBC_00410]
MSGQQERARRTRAAIVESAAVEFARSGYTAASLNQILERSNATKGAMYFHFGSKEDLARAVMRDAMIRYKQTTDRWLARTDLEPLEILHGIVDEIGLRFQLEAVLRAEYRLIVEPDFYADVQSGAASGWGQVGNVLAERAKERGDLRPDVDVAKFTRVLGAALAGQRYMSDLLARPEDIRELFEETLEMIVEASATPQWWANFKRCGWQDSAHEEDLR